MKPTRMLPVVLAFYCLGLGASSGQTSIEAGPIARVTAVQGGACEPACERAITTSTDFVDVPGASAEITVERKSLLIARFASDSSCAAAYTLLGVLTSGFCQVLVLASVGPGGDFVEMEPVTSGFEVFQMDRGSGAQAVERSSGPISPGTYTVKVQFRIFVSPPTADPDNVFTLTAWHLTVEAATIEDRRRH
jgi:hypothetical protein